MKQIDIVRCKYYPQTTIGELYVDDRLFCYTLEDTVRPYNIKVKKFTAIPAGTYFLTTRYSPSFKRKMLLLYNDESKTKIIEGEISFSWIYFHGGNKHKDSSGCILTCYEVNGNTIYKTAEKELYSTVKKWLDDGEEVLVTIRNSPQNN